MPSHSDTSEDMKGAVARTADEPLSASSSAGDVTNKTPLSEEEVKRATLQAAGKISAVAAMQMNRSERRRLSKINNGMKIPGITQPYVKPETKNKNGVMNVVFEKPSK